MAETLRSFKTFYNTYLRRRFSSKTKRKKKSPDAPDGKMTVGSATPEVVFREFCRVTEFKDTLTKFAELKTVLQVPPEARSVYHVARGRINISEARSVWRGLDKRAAGSAYKEGQACAGKSVLVIGAGPCGLRMAIESALLGARTVVVEMRDYVSRNNVLHLWPFVISDMKALGARVFHNKFCCGSREHSSIKAVQQILLKLALLLGVEVYAPVKFDGIIEPSKDSNGQERGWRAKFTPDNHEVLRDFEFDVIVGADGKSNTLGDFKRKTFRGKLAIAITANFVNHHTAADNAVEEIGGLFYVFNQPFFDGLREKANIELENFVYFKDDTHYFVMTARKQSLLKKGVLKQDFGDTQQLLSRDNVDRPSLLSYARETANLSTNQQLPELEFARDHHGREDVAIFDFTSLHQAENSCMIRERRGKQLLMTIVGDTLIEPFWPTGSGCARGFLSVFDAAWLFRAWAAGDRPVLELLAEREATLQLLSQTKPDNLNMRLTEYTLDPRTRYGTKLVQTKTLRPEQVRHLYDTGVEKPAQPEKPKLPPRDPSRKRAYDGTLNRKRLLEWFKKMLQPLSDVINVTDLTSSWRNGMALLGLVQLYRAGVVDVRRTNPADGVKNNQKAFDLILEHFGIAPTISAESLLAGNTPDRLAILSYLTQIQTHLESEKPISKAPKSRAGRKSSLARKFSSAGMLARLSRHTAKRAKLQETKPEVKRPRVGPLPPIPTQKRLSRTATLDKCRGIAAMRIKALQSNGGTAPADSTDSIPASPPPTTSPSAADVCCICQKRLYVSERQNARGHFFHRHCFRCLFCNAALWTHDFHDDRDTEGRVIFLCPDHKPIEEEDSMEEASAAIAEELKKDEEEPQEMSLEEMAQMVSPDMMGSSGMVGVPQGLTGMAMGGMMMGMAAAFTASAVAEEEDSDEEMSAEAESMALQEKPSEKRKTTRHHYYTLATSMRLMVGHEIQREYEEMEDEEQELESRGVKMERSLHNRQSVIDPTSEVSTNEGLVEEWMDVVRQKQEVQDKQNKLVLKAKLIELQERHMKLQRQLQRICMIDDLDEDLESLEALTENLSDEVNDTVSQILELRLFLKQSGESEA